MDTSLQGYTLCIVETLGKMCLSVTSSEFALQIVDDVRRIGDNKGSILDYGHISLGVQIQEPAGILLAIVKVQNVGEKVDFLFVKNEENLVVDLVKGF